MCCYICFDVFTLFSYPQQNYQNFKHVRFVTLFTEKKYNIWNNFIIFVILGYSFDFFSKHIEKTPEGVSPAHSLQMTDDAVFEALHYVSTLFSSSACKT